MRTVPINGEPCYTLGVIYISTTRQLTISDLARSAMGKHTATRVEIARVTSDLPVSERSRLLSLRFTQSRPPHWMSLGAPGPDLRTGYCRGCAVPHTPHFGRLLGLTCKGSKGWYDVYCYFSVVLFFSLVMILRFVLLFFGLALLGFWLLSFMASAFPFSRFRCLS